MARTHHTELPMLDSLHVSNEKHVERALDLVLDTGARSVGMRVRANTGSVNPNAWTTRWLNLR